MIMAVAAAGDVAQPGPVKSPSRPYRMGAKALDPKVPCVKQRAQQGQRTEAKSELGLPDWQQHVDQVAEAIVQSMSQASSAENPLLQ